MKLREMKIGSLANRCVHIVITEWMSSSPGTSSVLSSIVSDIVCFCEFPFELQYIVLQLVLFTLFLAWCFICIVCHLVCFLVSYVRRCLFCKKFFYHVLTSCCKQIYTRLYVVSFKQALKTKFKNLHAKQR
jgi:hypothetical protein